VPVLKGIDFRMEAGQKIALVGHSGAGKSTIVQLLMRYHTPSAGRVLVDGQDVQAYEVRQLRRNIGVVPQEVVLFGGSIRENIAYGKPGATDAEIREAARKANALEFIDTFPEGLDTVVGERGVKLSAASAAHRHCPGHSQRPRHPHPRRGHQFAGRRLGEAGAGGVG
jgi:ABC-type multidrug transport system fused ATPase/permease subunit